MRELMNAIDEQKKLIPKIIKNITSESGEKAFKSEHEIQGYMLGTFRYLLSDWEICREKPSESRYKKNGQGCLILDVKGKHGYIDFVLIKDDIRIGIEVEYPRGEGLKINNFISHIINDNFKLQNEKDLTLRYILVFLYNDPEFNFRNEINNIHLKDVFFAYMRLNKRGEITSGKLVKEIIKIPENWI
jgi:hypothetical protein